MKVVLPVLLCIVVLVAVILVPRLVKKEAAPPAPEIETTL